MIPTLGIFMSLNDPQWGNRGNKDGGDSNSGGPRRPNQGPPDLEELWKDFNGKLNGLFNEGTLAGIVSLAALLVKPCMVIRTPANNKAPVKYSTI
jgi:hypothetical protein